MLRLRDIMTTDILALHPGDSLRDAAQLFSSEHISGAPVVQAGRAVGVLSTTDLLDVEEITAGSPAAREGWAERGEFEAAESYEWSDDEPSAVYFTELGADAGADVLERFRETDRPEWDVLAERTVAEVMSRAIFSLSPDTAVAEAASYMLDNEVHRVLVLDGEEMVGVVSTTDLVRAVAEKGLAG